MQFDGKGFSITGAVLFSDASGFTALTERLALRPDGAEKMCEIMNAFLGIMIRIIRDYGGVCQTFAFAAAASE